MRNRWMWMVMFVLGAVAAAGVTWIMTGQPSDAVADSPDRLGDNIAVTGNIAQGVNGFYLINRDRTTWHLSAVAINPQTLKMTQAPRRNLGRDIRDAVKELDIHRPRSMDFMVVTGKYTAALDLVYVYEANSRLLVTYYFDAKKNEITRLGFTRLKK